MPKANDLIGPYQLIRKLGEGGFGEVWLAQDSSGSNQREVAVKMPLRSEIDLDALLQEATLWARASASNHPNVLDFLAARVFDGQVVLVSEYAPDGSLKDWLKLYGGQAPSVDAAVKMTRGILSGLEHLHARSIIHRDVKPDNVLLLGTTPRLADFGISRVIKSVSKSAVMAGTPPYMAPEAFKRKRNQQTDLWSVGVMLFQMLSGRLPVDGNDLAELYGAIREEEPESLPSAVPDWLRQVVAKALAKDPAQRYQTAAEMHAALTPQPPAVKEIPALPPPRRTVTIDEPPPKPEPIVIEAPPPKPAPKPEPAVVKPLPQPKPALPKRLRPAVKWGAGLAAVVIALATYLATKESTPSSPGVSQSPGGTQRQANSGEAFTVKLANGVNIEMVSLPGGEFTMGGERDDSEKPRHQVRVSPFAIGKYEVTQAQWKAVMGNNPSANKGDDLPVENVSWNDVNEFLKKAGNGYRLPTEAEWEYAARAGSTSDYSFGDDAGQLGNYAWFTDNSGGKTHPVEQKKPNQFGLCDMHGNAWEWCSDWYSGSYYAECQRQGVVTNPQGPSTGSGRVGRGGGWLNYAVDCRSAIRYNGAPGDRGGYVGFRLVRVGR